MGAAFDGDSSAGASDPAKGVEVAAERTDVVCRMFRIRRSNEMVHAATDATFSIRVLRILGKFS